VKPWQWTWTRGGGGGGVHPDIERSNRDAMNWCGH
jgi:hypothetical protein